MLRPKWHVWLLAAIMFVGPYRGFAQSPAVSEDQGKRSPLKQLTNSVGITMVLVPAGEFFMGSAESAELLAAMSQRYAPHQSSQAFASEHPRHEVRIAKPFYLGATETTVGQFRQFIDATGYHTEAERNGKGGDGYNAATGKREQKPGYDWRRPGFSQTDAHPVVNVSWNDAAAFCRWLSRKENKIYRLPTEAEWEYACRASSAGLYCNGDDPERLAEVANGDDASTLTVFPEWHAAISAHDGFVFTAPSARFHPNRFGLYDMHGNVWEWCADWYDDGYYARSPVDDPQGPTSGQYRVIRGGGWFCGPLFTRSACRSADSPETLHYFRGFRVAMAP